MEEFIRKQCSKSPVFPLFSNAPVLINNNLLNFYPMGNSPAKFLLETVPIDAVRANILLLGCGDNRHILFTCGNNLLRNETEITLMLDVIMCDMEPSIHARNIVLLKMVIDNIEMTKIWCLYYASSIDDICLTLLQSCASDLYNIGEDLQAWLASDIGTIIQFCDQRSYNTVREICKLYAKGKIDKKTQKEIQYKKKVSMNRYEENIVYTAIIRSCNPTGFAASSTYQLHDRIFKQYHKVGITPTCIYNPPSNIYNTTNSNSHCINPMFLCGKLQVYNLHYGQDPTLGFHLAHAYAEIKPTSTSKSTSTSKISEDDIYKICFDQFQDWCNGFKEHVTQSKIVIRVFTGDAFDLCYLLSDEGRRIESKTYNYFPKETSQCISLEVDIPNKFDVIDTSNLCDSCGLLNILLTCEPLLANNSHSIINTEFISSVSSENSLKDFLEGELRCTTNTFAAITGLVLSESYSFTTDNLTNLKTRMNYNISKQIGGVITFTWHRSLSNMKYSCSSSESFITMLLSIYKRIFKLQYGSSDLIDMIQDFQNNIKKLIGQNSFAYPSGHTFIKLLKYAKVNILGVTDELIEKLLKEISQTRFLMQANYYQELNVWCTRLGVLPPSVLKRIGNDCFIDFNSVTRGAGIGYFGENPSLLVYVTLLVPKKYIEKLLDIILCPMLELIINNSQFDNRFTSLNILYISNRTCTNNIADNNDMNNHIKLKHFSLHLGARDDYEYVAFTTLVPSYMLMMLRSDELKLSLSLTTLCYNKITPDVKQKLQSTPTIFEKGFEDTSYVSWMNCPEPYATTTNDNDNDNNSTTAANISSISPMLSTPNIFIIKPYVLNISTQGEVLSYTTEITITDTTILMNPYNITVLPTNHHPCIIRLTLNDHIVDMKVPHLADIENYKLQISRKSSKLVLTFPTLHRPSKNLFPMIKEDDKLCFWGITRLSLENLPKLYISSDSKKYASHWLYVLAGMQINMQEREDESSGKVMSALFSFKRSVHSMLLMCTGLSGNTTTQIKWYGFKLHENIQMIMYVNAIRLNAAVGSVVVDAAIAIVNDTNRRDILGFYNALERKGKTIGIMLSGDEWILWKNMIPVLNERFRSGWKHDENCEYLSSDNSSSLSLSSSISSLSVSPARQQQQSLQLHVTICHCHCCLGKGHQGTDFESSYQKTSVFPNFIRIALSPLFPVEEVTYNNSGSSSQTTSRSVPLTTSHKAKPASSAASAVPTPPISVAVSSSSSPEIRPAFPSTTATTITIASATDQNVHSSCGHCKKYDVKLSQCGRCKQISYCGRECQVAHWKIHKKDCTK